MGIFRAASRVEVRSQLSDWTREWLRDSLDWFNENLPHPPKNFTTGRAVFWFKSSAEKSIRSVWELVHVLRQHGHCVEVHKCRRLGNILYEDKLQVAAYPSKLDGRITVQ